VVLVAACGSSKPQQAVDANDTDAPPVDSPGDMCVPSPAALRARWRGEHNTLDDTGNYNGTAVATLGYVAGRHGMAFKLDGLMSLVTADPNDALWPSASFSIEAWVRTTGVSGTFLSKYDCGGTGCGASLWGFRLDDQGHPQSQIRTGPGVASTVTAPNLINDGAWHYLVGVRDVDSKFQVLYVDGAVAAQQDISGSSFLAAMSNADGNSDPVTIGAGRIASMSTYQNYAIGAIDEIAYYESVISATAVAAIYAARDGICP
jgi:hypothetical protein